METKILNLKTFAYLIAGVIIIFVVYQTMKRFGLIKTFAQRKTARLVEKASREEKLKTGVEKAEKKNIESIFSESDYFNPTLWKDQPASYLMKTDVARAKATSIRKGIRYPGTIETLVFKAFRNLTSKYMVSQIAFHYAANYKRDLLTDLVSDLTKEELVSLYDIIKKLV